MIFLFLHFSIQINLQIVIFLLLVQEYSMQIQLSKAKHLMIRNPNNLKVLFIPTYSSSLEYMASSKTSSHGIFYIGLTADR